MTSIAKAWLAVAVGVTAAALVFAGETEQVQKRSGIVARLQVDRSEVALSGEIVVTRPSKIMARVPFSLL